MNDEAHHSICVFINSLLQQAFTLPSYSLVDTSTSSLGLCSKGVVIMISILEGKEQNVNHRQRQRAVLLVIRQISTTDNSFFKYDQTIKKIIERGYS